MKLIDKTELRILAIDPTYPHMQQQSAHQCSQVMFSNIEYRPLYLTFKMNAALSSLLTFTELVLHTWTEL